MSVDRNHPGRHRPIRRGRLAAEILEARQLLATILVNTTGDADGASGGSTLSLRQAIEVSNGTLALSALSTAQAALVDGSLGTPNTIDFAIPGVGPFIIEPTSLMPAITSPVVIDGYSQPGAHPNTNGPGQGKNTVILIELDGANATGAVGLDLKAGQSTVQGLAIGGFAIASYLGLAAGIVIENPIGDAIQGDFIGTDATGTVPLPNAVGILEEAPTTPSNGFDTIGGTSAGAGNVISGNSYDGLVLYGMTDLLEGNFIGTDVTGTKPIASDGTGIEDGGTHTTIGGSAAGAGNLISGNGVDGLSIYGLQPDLAPFEPSALVEGNLIGTDVTGTLPLPNVGNGISTNHLINSGTDGGTAEITNNVIAFNGGSGVAAYGSTFQGNPRGLISRNSIFANGDLGIDFPYLTGITGSFYPTPVVLDSVTTSGTGSVISGTLAPFNTSTYTIEFFTNTAPDPSGFGQGQTYLGSTQVTTDASGHASFTFTTPTALLGQYITATSTDPIGNTSGFSLALLGDTASTTTTLVAPETLATYDQPLTFTAAVAPTTPGIVTGEVAFSSQGHFLGTAPLDASGMATLTTNKFGLGSFPVQAFYLGDMSHAPSQSDPVVVTIVGLATTTTLIGPSGFLLLGQPATFTAAVQGPGGVFNGTVAFTDNGILLGTSTLDASGLAVLTTDAFGIGPQLIQAAYLGYVTDAPSLSNPIIADALPTVAYGGPIVTTLTSSNLNSITITFSRPLRLSTAQVLQNYAIIGTDGKAVAIESATYDPVDDSVTLTTRQPLKPHRSYRVKVNGVRVGRVDDADGIPLAGKAGYLPGTNYTGTITTGGVIHAKKHSVSLKKSATVHKSKH